MGQLYPIFADIAGKMVVVVGGGRVAQRKVESLLACEAQVVVVSPELTEQLGKLGEDGVITVRRRGFEKSDLADAWLVIAASGDEKINQQVSEQATMERVFCNVADDPQRCSFQVPAVVNRGALQLAISTAGMSPALAKRIRQRLEKEFGSYYEDFLAGLGELRQQVKEKYPQDQERRAAILSGFVDSAALDLLRNGKIKEFQELLESWKNRPD